jgi:hypothetical protein
MDSCPSCASEYARQRELTRALQALAAEAQEWTAPAGMEQRLLAELAAQRGTRPAREARPAAGRWRYVLATAAMVTLAVWGIKEAGEGGRPGTAPAVIDPSRQASPTTTPRPAAPLAANPRTANPRPENPRPESPRTASRPSTPAVASELETQASRTIPVAATPVEFMSIPGAIGLPDLESGTVLRMELPLAVLPEYGLQIPPDAARTSVEADVLVGQDGQPRAIRLVGATDNVAQDFRSRQ